jgi:hypothetical protein
MSKPVDPTVDQAESTVSQKRQFAATVTSTAVTVVLGIGTSILINKVATRVHNKIAPQPEIENN